MTDLTNVWPSWGETGELPPVGFFYERGDRPNEKHLDALWNNLNTETQELIEAIVNRTKDLEGNVALDNGLVASAGTGTNVNVTASTAGAYVDGQRTGSINAETVSLSSNGTGSTRTDTIQVSKDGIISANEGSTSAASNQMKIAEVDVTTSDTISAVRQYVNRNIEFSAQEEQPTDPLLDAGIWIDTDDMLLKFWNGTTWDNIATRDWVLANIFSQSDADQRYVLKSGDTMTGALNMGAKGIYDVNPIRFFDAAPDAQYQISTGGYNLTFNKADGAGGLDNKFVIKSYATDVPNGEVREQGQRVYSPNNPQPVPISENAYADLTEYRGFAGANNTSNNFVNITGSGILLGGLCVGQANSVKVTVDGVSTTFTSADGEDYPNRDINGVTHIPPVKFNSSLSIVMFNGSYSVECAVQVKQ